MHYFALIVNLIYFLQNKYLSIFYKAHNFLNCINWFYLLFYKDYNAIVEQINKNNETTISLLSLGNKLQKTRFYFITFLSQYF